MDLLVLTDVSGTFDWERPHQVAARLPAALGAGDGRVVWLSTPALLDEARALSADLLVYDVMGYLPGYVEALKAADLVLTGGRSLQRAITTMRPDAQCVASGVDVAHLATARARRPAGVLPRRRPVAGYAGLIDERIDLELVAELASALPAWQIRMIGPVVGVDVPRLANLSFPGGLSYADLPAALAGFDVGLLPFALNQATPSISPTRALEYLAAGLPVVATRMPDVADAFSDVVALQDDGLGFAAACVRVVDDCAESRASRVQPLLKWHDWDTVTARMAQAIAARLKHPVGAI